MSDNAEHFQDNSERSAEMSIEASADRLEKLGDQQEKQSELSPRDIESRAEKAKVEALESAVSVEAGGKEKDTKPKNHSQNRRGPIGKKQQDVSYKKTMKQVQSELPAVSKTFSKIIHSKFIENTSEVVASTVARPNAILMGSIFAFTLTLLSYTVAKTIGYRLSGFETIASFVLGWTLGIIYDYLKVLFTGKK